MQIFEQSLIDAGAGWINKIFASIRNPVASLTNFFATNIDRDSLIGISEFHSSKINDNDIKPLQHDNAELNGKPG